MDSHANTTSNTLPGPASLAARRPFLTAFPLSLGAAVSLGVTRFSYALLLPPCAPTSTGPTSCPVP
jgi:hypothetical protein